MLSFHPPPQHLIMSASIQFGGWRNIHSQRGTMKKNKNLDLSRRHFLGAAAGAAVFSIVPRHVLGGAKFVAPSEKVNIAIIGAGGQGRTNARALFNEAEAQIIAVCDVAEVTDLEPFYYKGKGGRKTVIAEVEKHYQEKNKDFKCAE